MLGSNTEFSSSGFGGFGGGGVGFGGGGIPPVGLFGLVGADGFGRRDCDRKDDNHLGFDLISQKIQTNNINDNTNDRFNDLGDNIRSQAINEGIRGVMHEVCDVRHNVTREVGDAKTALGFRLCDIEKTVMENRFQSALNTRDIITSGEKCCCETKELIREEADKTRALVSFVDKERIRDENVVLRGQIDNCHKTAEIADLRGYVDKQITNVNFGTQQVLQAVNSLVANGNKD